MMDSKFIELIKKYKIYILASLLLIFFVRSCNRGRQVSKLEKTRNLTIETTDSLLTVIESNNYEIDKFPEVLRVEKLRIYLALDDTISRVDRSPQLMGLHTMIKDEILDLQK